jgi:hypothetical protein
MEQRTCTTLGFKPRKTASEIQATKRGLIFTNMETNSSPLSGETRLYQFEEGEASQMCKPKITEASQVKQQEQVDDIFRLWDVV